MIRFSEMLPVAPALMATTSTVIKIAVSARRTATNAPTLHSAPSAHKGSSLTKLQESAL